ncbi:MULTISPECIES: hypothetical protein [Cobetia]|uniref:hypothetical protein n=1 Tax=Cobetia TaxID=204286 RepID=UPI00178CDBE6|nr:MULTISPECIES: hypothetical protein [Cobetia]MBE2167455.1 hypothetical protein [Cobetia sp. 2AS1]MDH2421718.1 hypothetical protein [Cobetia litoralis]MDH2447100.1 hypothetical protein [Cobetia sp. 2AS]
MKKVLLTILITAIVIIGGIYIWVVNAPAPATEQEKMAAAFTMMAIKGQPTQDAKCKMLFEKLDEFEADGEAKVAEITKAMLNQKADGLADQCLEQRNG